MNERELIETMKIFYEVEPEAEPTAAAESLIDLLSSGGDGDGLMALAQLGAYSIATDVESDNWLERKRQERSRCSSEHKALRSEDSPGTSAARGPGAGVFLADRPTPERHGG